MKYLFLFIWLFLSLAALGENISLSTKKKSEEQKDEPVRWKLYSKNKSHIYISHKKTEGSNKDSFGLFYTQNFAGAKYKNFSFGLRKTMTVFINNAFDDSIKDYDYKYSNELFNHSWEHWLDRVSFSGKWKLVDFTAGDFYESMNRGMAFSMKNDPVYGDNSIRGGSINIHWKGFHMKTFGGRANPQIRDKTTFQRTKEADDWLAGMEVGYRWKKLNFGLQYGYGNYGKYDVNLSKTLYLSMREYIEKEFHLTGAYVSLSNPVPGFTFYSGAVYVPYGYQNQTMTTQLQENTPMINKNKIDLQNSAAFYSSALYYVDIGKKKNRLTFKLESKLYRNYYMNYTKMEDPEYKRRYFNPPTLLPIDLQIYNEFDTWAVGTKVAFNDRELTKAKYSINFVKGDSLNNFVKNNPPLDSKDKEPGMKEEHYKKEDFYYLAIKGEKHFSNFNFAALLGAHYTYGNIYQGEKNKRRWIVSGFHLGGYFSKFSYKFNNDYYNKNLTDSGIKIFDNAHELKTVLDLSWNNRYFLTLKNTFWHNNTEDEMKSWYPGAALGFKYNIVRLYISGGLEKGGFTCDGGMCRVVPDFKGVKAELDVSL